MVFNANFNNISAISCWSVLLVEETGENNQTLSHNVVSSTGADPGFQVRGAHLKKLRRMEGGAKIFGVFRVKNHDFTPKNHIFSNSTGGRRVRPLDPPLEYTSSWVGFKIPTLVVIGTDCICNHKSN